MAARVVELELAQPLVERHAGRFSKGASLIRGHRPKVVRGWYSNKASSASRPKPPRRNRRPGHRAEKPQRGRRAPGADLRGRGHVPGDLLIFPAAVGSEDGPRAPRDFPLICRLIGQNVAFRWSRPASRAERVPGWQGGLAALPTRNLLISHFPLLNWLSCSERKCLSFSFVFDL